MKVAVSIVLAGLLLVRLRHLVRAHSDRERISYGISFVAGALVLGLVNSDQLAQPHLLLVPLLLVITRGTLANILTRALRRADHGRRLVV